MKYFTTLRKLREHNACAKRYGFLAQSLGQDWDDDAKISLEYILNNNGLDDAIWALRAVDGIDKEARLFACDCAEHVLYIFEEQYPGNDRPRNAIQASRDFAHGEIKKERLDAAFRDARAARTTAWYLDNPTAWDAASASVKAASAYAYETAWEAVGASNDASGRAEEIDLQEQLFRKYFCQEVKE